MIWKQIETRVYVRLFINYVTEIWDALRAAAEADLELSQAIVDSAGIISQNTDMTICYDESGTSNKITKFGVH